MIRALLPLLLLVASAGLLALAVEGQEGGPGAMPPARPIPGINAEDRYPHGCVDCHIHYVDMQLDTRFSTMLRAWAEEVPAPLLAKARAVAPAGLTLTGKHPEAAQSLQDVPAACLECHGAASEVAPPFASLLHSVHLVGGDTNHFMTLFQGECTHCHKLDLATGRVTMPSAPER